MDANGAKAAKLEVWGRSPFAYNGTRSTVYAEALLANLSHYPCGDPIELNKDCLDLRPRADKSRIISTTALGKFVLYPASQDSVTVDHSRSLNPDGFGSLQLNYVNGIRIGFNRPAEIVQLKLACFASLRVEAISNSSGRPIVVDVKELSSASGVVGVKFGRTGAAIAELRFFGAKSYLHELCLAANDGITAETIVDQNRLRQITVSSVESWYSEEQILRPHRTYKLVVVTESERRGPDGAGDSKEETA